MYHWVHSETESKMHSQHFKIEIQLQPTGNNAQEYPEHENEGIAQKHLMQRFPHAAHWLPGA